MTNINLARAMGREGWDAVTQCPVGVLSCKGCLNLGECGYGRGIVEDMISPERYIPYGRKGLLDTDTGEIIEGGK